MASLYDHQVTTHLCCLMLTHMTHISNLNPSQYYPSWLFIGEWLLYIPIADYYFFLCHVLHAEYSFNIFQHMFYRFYLVIPMLNPVVPIFKSAISSSKLSKTLHSLVFHLTVCYPSSNSDRPCQLVGRLDFPESMWAARMANRFRGAEGWAATWQVATKTTATPPHPIYPWHLCWMMDISSWQNQTYMVRVYYIIQQVL